LGVCGLLPNELVMFVVVLVLLGIDDPKFAIYDFIFPEEAKLKPVELVA